MGNEDFFSELLKKGYSAGKKLLGLDSEPAVKKPQDGPAGKNGQKQGPPADRRRELLRDCELLAAVFQDYPQLAPQSTLAECAVSQSMTALQLSQRKQKLTAVAARCCKEQLVQARRRSEQAAWVYAVNSSMSSELGALGYLNIMLDSARRGQRARWETYSSYFKQEMEKLGVHDKNRRREILVRDDELPRDAAALARLLRGQLEKQSGAPAETEYETLYKYLTALCSPRQEDDLAAWHARAAEAVRQGMATLPQELREALAQEFPHLAPDGPGGQIEKGSGKS